MSNKINSESDPGQPMIYQIRIKAHLGREWTDWFGGLTITLEDNGETLLTGPVVDQAALHGLLKKVRIVNLVTVFSYILGAAGEGLTQLWLLIMGVKMPQLAAPPLDRAVIARDTSAATATFSLTEESRISE